MRDETSDWLTPMMEEARRLEDAGTPIGVPDLMSQASMPAAEAFDRDDPVRQLMESAAATDPDVRHGAIDWVRFGRLLRERLGWEDYPDHPDFPEMRDAGR